MTRTGQDAINYARSRIGPDAMPASGYCLQFVRECFDTGPLYGSAIEAWNSARARHPGDRNPPPAVPLYFATPSPYDHVTFNVDASSEVISTFNADVRSFSGIDSIEANFDGTYLGWAEDINGVTIWTPDGGEEDDMNADQDQRLRNVESAVGRLEGLWGAADGRNRVADFDVANDLTAQTNDGVGRIESDIDQAQGGDSLGSALMRWPLLIVGAVVIAFAVGNLADPSDSSDARALLLGIGSLLLGAGLVLVVQGFRQHRDGGDS